MSFKRKHPFPHELDFSLQGRAVFVDLNMGGGGGVRGADYLVTVWLMFSFCQFRIRSDCEALGPGKMEHPGAESSSLTWQWQ